MRPLHCRSACAPTRKSGMVRGEATAWPAACARCTYLRCISPARTAERCSMAENVRPMSSSASITSAPWPRPAVISLATTSHTTTGPLPSASRRQASAASAPSPSPSRSISTEVSMAIIGRSRSDSAGTAAGGVASLEFRRLARLAAAQVLHHVVGGDAVRQLETAADARDRVADVLAQDDPAAVQLDLQHGAFRQPERIAHGLGQRDLAAFGDSGFHVRPLDLTVRCGTFRYAYSIRTESS